MLRRGNRVPAIAASNLRRSQPSCRLRVKLRTVLNVKFQTKLNPSPYIMRHVAVGEGKWGAKITSCN